MCNYCHNILDVIPIIIPDIHQLREYISISLFECFSIFNVLTASYCDADKETSIFCARSGYCLLVLYCLLMINLLCYSVGCISTMASRTCSAHFWWIILLVLLYVEQVTAVQNMDLEVVFIHRDSSFFFPPPPVFKNHSVTFISRRSNLLI